ncbi:hypothetical protein BJX61DRAFT_543276 [Aspergillus egyptiacus]|nr:hypothetical protein BJX61DRAFT_543276 [Aspergillus egyptiacus]
MPSSRNKDRVYVGLYARGGGDPNTYHWALIVGPKKEAEGNRGYRYHVQQRVDPAEPSGLKWIYQPLEIPLVQTSMLLGRILIAKVTNGEQLRSTLAAVPIVQNDKSWTCRIWVKNAVAALEADRKTAAATVRRFRIVGPWDRPNF